MTRQPTGLMRLIPDDTTPQKGKKLAVLEKRRAYLAALPTPSHWNAAEASALMWALGIVAQHVRDQQAQRLAWTTATRLRRQLRPLFAPNEGTDND